MIVDASVVLKAFLPEDDAEDAFAVLQEPGLSSVSFLVVEFGHVLTKRVRGRLVSVEAARRIWAEFREAPIRLVEGAAHADAALQLAVSLHSTYYDCLYLALALAEDDTLVTADRRFFAAVQASPDLASRVKRLGAT